MDEIVAWAIFLVFVAFVVAAWTGALDGRKE
jgi:hypothetical protein